MGLSARDLTVTLGGRVVLDKVSFDVAPGRVTVVLGANGAGKSTLLRAMAGLIPVGGVTLDDRDVATIAPRERAQAIGYLPQDAAVHWNMAVRDVVALGRLPHGDRGAAAIDAALLSTNTTPLAKRAVRSLSGGERARVLLARVLAGDPRWLIADEPLANLDPLHQLETLQLLRAAAARGMGVIVVMHDLTLAARVADEVILLKNGETLAQGEVATVLTEANISAAFGVRIAIVSHNGTSAIIPDLMI